MTRSGGARPLPATDLLAQRVLPGGAGDLAGLKANDLLTEVNDHPGPPRQRPGARTLQDHQLWAGVLRHHPGRHRARIAGPGHSRPGGPQPGPRPSPHRPHLSGHRHLCPLPPLDRSPRDPLLPVLPGLVRALRAQVHRPARRRSTGRSSGPISWPTRCSRRCLSISPSASPRSG